MNERTNEGTSKHTNKEKRERRKEEMLKLELLSGLDVNARGEKEPRKSMKSF
jgi:hypothetical protein